MSRNGYLTPDAATNFICRRVLVPDTMVYALNGAIGELGSYWNWEQFGGLTEEEAARLGHEIYLSMDDCGLDSRMIGSIMFYAGTMPDGVLLCDGATYSEVDYPELYESLGGVGGIFDVPDLRGKMLIGAGGGFPVGSTGGESVHTLSVSEIPAHTHASETNEPDLDLEGAGVPLPAAGISFAIPSGSTGGGLPHENMPPYHALEAGIIALPVIAVSGASVGIAVVVDEKSQGTDGGDFNNNVWIKRDLNTVTKTASWLSLSGDEVTLLEGEYFVLASLPSVNVGSNKGRILRVSDNAVFMGQSVRGDADCTIMVALSVSGSEVFRIEHLCKNTNLSNGLGDAVNNYGVEVYSEAVFLKYG